MAELPAELLGYGVGSVPWESTPADCCGSAVDEAGASSGAVDVCSGACVCVAAPPLSAGADEPDDPALGGTVAVDVPVGVTFLSDVEVLWPTVCPIVDPLPVSLPNSPANGLPIAVSTPVISVIAMMNTIRAAAAVTYQCGRRSRASPVVPGLVAVGAGDQPVSGWP
jgi:hypothetical protein